MQLARAIGCGSLGNISRWECKGGGIELRYLTRLAEHYNVPIDRLVKGRSQVTVPQNGRPTFSGRKLREYRELNRMTQQELGEAIGVSSETISGYEKGKYSPNIDRCLEIATVLDVDLVDLLEESHAAINKTQKQDFTE